MTADMAKVAISVTARPIAGNTEPIDDFYQVGYRPHPKFFHSRATVQLHCDFTHSKLGRDLLVHKTRCHVANYFLFSGCQGAEERLKCRFCRIPLGRGAVSVDGCWHGVEKVLIAEWLR